jgi:mono/diheme cytochrome c family protein
MPNRPLRLWLLALLAALPLLALRTVGIDQGVGAETPPKAPAPNPGELTGEQLYKSDCVRCHGANGQGTKRHPRRLEGDRSLAQLTTLIHKTMPEDSPGSLTQAEAAAVAAYVHDAFYSKLARERNRPARVELARLTVRQYRQAVADLVGAFRPQRSVSDERGLKAAYFKNRRFRPNDRVLERTDANVAFDFGTESPVPDKTAPDEFSIRWVGSLIAPQTGEYELIVRTEHAARLWLNDPRKPLIDAWVKSGNDTEYKATLYLVAGRAYPLRLEYSKAKQGVDDSKKEKKKKPSPKSSIFLLWKPPGRAAEPVPRRNLTPAESSQVYACATPFPPDDRSYGWERGTAVSKEWDEATTEAALGAAAYVVAHLDELAGVRAGGPRGESGLGNPASINLDGPREKAPADRPEKLRAFARAFAERAFRRPLTADQQTMIDRQFSKGADPEAGVKRVVLLVLKSPWFLYREVGGGQTGYDIAARLSFGLWDSLPDKQLLDAARAGKLSSNEEIARQAERMLADLRGRAKLREFLLTWLKADHGLDLAKEAKKFPGFDAAVISDLRTSLELFLDDVAWSDGSDFRRLLQSDELFLSPRLAKFYGVDLPAGAKEDFCKVQVDAGRRAGVLSHPYLMTSFSHSGESSPIHRGVFLARGVLGLALRPPPEAVAPLAPELHPNLTTRQRVALQTNPSACMTCHGVINPLGFTLENFDAVGRFRTQDKGKPIDATGAYTTRRGRTVQVNGARELAAFLAESQEAHAAFVEQMFHHLVQQPMQAYGKDTLEELRRSFVADGFHIRKLAVRVMLIAARGERETTSKREG